MDFKDLLVKRRINLERTMVMRHRPTEPNLRKVLPWLAAEKPEVFNAYQQAQRPDAEKALLKAELVASFIAQEADKAIFVGLYRRGASQRVTSRQFWAIPAMAELKPFGVRGPQRQSTCLWFDLEPLSHYEEWKGRLVVKWPSGRLW